MSKYQYRVYRKDGKPCPEAEGDEALAILEETVESFENLIDSCYNEHEQNNDDFVEDEDILATMLSVVGSE